MNKKALALIIGGLILIALIVYFIFFYNFNKNNSTNQVSDNGSGQTQTAAPVVSKNTPAVKTAQPVSDAEKSHDAATQLAIFFAERYGTSSSQADFSNLSELELFMTDAMQQRTQAFIASERAKVSGAPKYQALVTQAVIADFQTFNETAGTAQGTVKTKRQETDVNGKVSAYDQDLAISLKKVGGEWKVDSADWVKR